MPTAAFRDNFPKCRAFSKAQRTFLFTTVTGKGKMKLKKPENTICVTEKAKVLRKNFFKGNLKMCLDGGKASNAEREKSGQALMPLRSGKFKKGGFSLPKFFLTQTGKRWASGQMDRVKVHFLCISIS